MLRMARAVQFRHKNKLRQHMSLVLEKRQVPIFSCRTNKGFGDGRRRRHFIKTSLWLFSILIAWRGFGIFIFVCLVVFFHLSFCFFFFSLESFVFS